MGETRVDLQHLLEDLRDAYTGSLEETILTEVIANALDSGAARVRLLTDPGTATLTVIDDGRGMQRRELARYHDIAASTKQRGEGIGFAGVGIKLGLLVSREVITETRRGATHVATRWHLASRHRAPWKWLPPSGLTTARGTAVQMVLTNQLSPLLDSGWVRETVGRMPEFSTTGGTSDGRFIAPTGAQVVELGVINATIHKVNECVRVEDIDMVSRMYERVMELLLLPRPL